MEPFQKLSCLWNEMFSFPLFSDKIFRGWFRWKLTSPLHLYKNLKKVHFTEKCWTIILWFRIWIRNKIFLVDLETEILFLSIIEGPWTTTTSPGSEKICSATCSGFALYASMTTSYIAIASFLGLLDIYDILLDWPSTQNVTPLIISKARTLQTSKSKSSNVQVKYPLFVSKREKLLFSCF